MEKGSHLEGEEILHDGAPGEQRDSNIFIGPSLVWRYNLNDNQSDKNLFRHIDLLMRKKRY